MKFTYTIEELDKKVRLYHEDCETRRDVFPDKAGLMNMLDIEDDEYEAMQADEEYRKILRWSQRRRESWLTRNAVDNKKTNGCKMLLAQPENGGYSDKPDTKKNKEVVVKLVGFDNFKQEEKREKNDE